MLKSRLSGIRGSGWPANGPAVSKGAMLAGDPVRTAVRWGGVGRERPGGRSRGGPGRPRDGSLADQCSGWTEAPMNSEERRVKMYAWTMATKASMIMMNTAKPTQRGLRVLPTAGLKA